MKTKLKVRIGKGAKIDKGATIGYCPSRIIKDLKLVIGKNSSIRSGTVVYAGSLIGDGLETGHNVVIREENTIGNTVRIWSNSVIDFRCLIGNNVKIHCNCYISQKTKIEDDVFLAPGVMIANEKYPTGQYAEERIVGAVIRRGALIGINATILPGVEIGKNSLIGSGSVVTRSVPDNKIAYGNPARVIRSIDKKELGY